MGEVGMIENTESFLEMTEGKYDNQPVETVMPGFDSYVRFGNTGLRLQESPKGGWIMDFLPEAVAIPATARDKVVVNGHLFVWGLEGMREWYQGSSEARKVGLIRQDTNKSMHDFRLKLFGEISKASSVSGIYEEVSEADKRFYYEFAPEKFIEAIDKLESLPESKTLRYFKYRDRAKKYWG